MGRMETFTEMAAMSCCSICQLVPVNLCWMRVDTKVSGPPPWSLATGAEVKYLSLFHFMLITARACSVEMHWFVFMLLDWDVHRVSPNSAFQIMVLRNLNLRTAKISLKHKSSISHIFLINSAVNQWHA